MFGTLRKHSQPLWIAIIIVVVISFVVFFTPNFDPFESGATRSADAAAVDQARSQVLLDEIIEYRQRQVMIQMLARAGRTQEALQLAGGNFQQAFQLMQSPDVLTSANAGRMAGNSRHIDLNGDEYNDINSLEYRARIRLRKLTLAAELGIVISDNAVNAARNYMVQNLSGTQEVSTDQIEKLLKQLSEGGFISAGAIGQEQFDHYLRTRLILQQLNTLMTRSAGFWPDADMADSLARQSREYATEAAFISLTNHTASATNYADISKAEGFTNHFNQVAFEYQVPVRHTIAYVKIDLADFEADIRKEIKFDDEVQKIIELHNTTTNRLTDINGTALPVNATNLLARAEEEVRKTPLGERIFTAANAAARIKKKEFQDALFSKGVKATSTADLFTTAKQFDLTAHTATISENANDTGLPTQVITDAFASSLKEGKLLESSVYVPNPHRPEAIYILGLQKIIPLELRKYNELTEDEQKEVHEGFLKSETRRRAREAGEAFRAAALASLKEGQTFTHAATNAGLSVITLSPFTLYGNADTNHTDLLKDFVPLSTLQTALNTHEQNQINKADDKKENLTEYQEVTGGGVSFNESVAGYVLHINERINPANPDANALRSFASTVRQNTRTQAAGNDWFAKHQQQLDAEIIISSLESRRNGLPSEINEVNENILYKEKLVAQNLAAALEQAGISEQAVIDPLKNWSDATTGTLKKYIRENYFAETPSHPAAAKVIVPMLSAGLRKHWAELDDLLADLNQLKALQAGGLDQAISEAKQSAK